jgi:hypothetical protein
VSTDGPELELLTHYLAECPPDFLALPRVGSEGEVEVLAVVGDLLRDIAGDPLRRTTDTAFHGGARSDRNRLRLILVVCWLLHHDWFLHCPELTDPVFALLKRGLDELAGALNAESCVSDPDRREELVRHCLDKLGLRPLGETEAQAKDRLTSLDSIERARVIRAAEATRTRQRRIQEELQRKAREEAAAAKAARE